MEEVPQVDAVQERLGSLKETHLDAVKAIADESFPSAWSEEDFRFFLSHPSGLSLGLTLKPEGEKRRLASYFIALRIGEDLDIVTVATHPGCRGRGYAKQLVRKALEESGAERAFLEVETGNQAAIGMYHRLGFKIVGCRKKYYDNTRDALVMRWEKSDPPALH